MWLPRRKLDYALLPIVVTLVLILPSASVNSAKLRHSRHINHGYSFENKNYFRSKQDEQHNHKPVFSNCANYSPVVKEEEPPGTFVIQVMAEDRDPPEEGGTITYSFVTISGEKLKFEINNKTGEIRTTQILDRDEPEREKEAYLTVLATDNGRPQLDDVCTFKVTIEDVNDNAPVFDKVTYTESVPQDLPLNSEVMRVSAADIDDGNNSVVRYSLKSKKSDDSAQYFRIDTNTGVIFLNKAIDKNPDFRFSMIATAEDLGKEPKSSQIDLDIQVVESHKKAPSFVFLESKEYVQENFSDFDASIVTLRAQSNNDQSPDLLFELVTGRTEQTNKKNTFRLESTNGTAHIKLAKHLDYESIANYTLLVRVQNKYQLAAETVVNIRVLDVNDNIPIFGKLEKGSVLENEPPGVPVMQVRAIDADGTSAHNQVTVIAKDEDGSSNKGLQESVTVNITLIDINDNAPFLDMRNPVVWDENQKPGKIIELKARDLDTDKNGPPFTFKIDDSADNEIQSKFHIENKDLYAQVTFDREERKRYVIPISIKDSGTPTMTGTSMLTVIIGDVNDNPMSDGESSIFVYNYKGEAPDSEIGRVYVNDPDDWDLPDKRFNWISEHDGFQLNPETGMITMLAGTSNSLFTLKFGVKEQRPDGSTVVAEALVNVTVREIPEVAVMKSGSVRFYGINAEEFVAPLESGTSKKDIFHEILANMLNVSAANVDVFTVLHSPHHNSNKSLLDVRFSAHGSPYYAAEKLNTIVARNARSIEEKLNAEILLVNIDECLVERLNCNNSCRSYLNVSRVPYSVFTNSSSFVGVRAIVDPQCICVVTEPTVCLNGGTAFGERCECPSGFEGPRCELLAIGFHGDGYAIMPPPGQACDDSHLGLEITPQTENGLIFYFGPMSYTPKLGIQDFMALELENGFAVLYVDYGTGTVKLKQKYSKLTDGKSHRIDVYWTKNAIEIKIDNCAISACMSLTAPLGSNEFLNVNSPMQVGGTLSNLTFLADKLGWNHRPTEKGFAGCVRNMTINGDTYNLGMPALSINADSGCAHEMAKAVSFGIDSNFLVAILVCVSILLILLLAVVVHKKATDDLFKDMDDIRENIINYDDEGGGEGDTAYDLNVLRAMYDDPIDSKIAPIGLQARAEPSEVPDTFDDVRHYAYEGDGNSSGSLSSLASCTDDDGDLQFSYLSNFGPRFRKLADMYGEETSDDESDGAGTEKNFLHVYK
ncbi:DE-cadherin-like [Belonocnema kinseyi]|uniref:DE-cadherin-like n=1 Tax=Belonocnema kinseyi TaxID=2817044 RepID=UPI00143D7DD1|nr:DE-cadherin-like [Belonocnema kinseyi]